MKEDTLNNNHWDSRIHFMDNLRAAAMFLGLVLHAAIFYNIWPFPLGRGQTEDSNILHILIEIIHVFRMDLFFLVAGFFACLFMRKKGLKQLVKNRILRILIPFVACFFVLQPWWSAINIQMFTANAEGFWTVYFRHFLDPLTIVRYEYPIGQWFQHLWFLQFLMIFIFAQLVFVLIGENSKLAERLSYSVRRLFECKFGLYLMVLISYFILLFCPPWSEVPHIGLPLNTICHYGFFYFIGFLIFNSPEIIENAFSHLHYNLIPVALGLFVLITMVNSTLLSAPIEILGQNWNIFKGTNVNGKIEWSAPFVGNTYQFAGLMRGDLQWHIFSLIKSYTHWFTVIGFIYIFRRFCNFENPVWRYLSQSSYWVYILHFPLQFTVYHYIFSGRVESPMFGFLGILIVSSVICLVSYHYLIRSTAVGVLLNGRKFSKNISEEKHLFLGLCNQKLIAAVVVGLLMLYAADTLERKKDNGITVWAAWKDVDLIKKFIDENPGKIQTVLKSDGRNALHFGVLNFPNSGTDKVIDLLVGKGINVNSTDHTGQTPLHYAVRTAHFEAVRKLCELGANPNQRAHWQGLTPLHLAAVVGSTNIINELLKAGGDPDLKQSRGESARDLLSLFHKIEIPMFSRIKM